MTFQLDIVVLFSLHVATRGKFEVIFARIFGCEIATSCCLLIEVSCHQSWSSPFFRCSNPGCLLAAISSGSTHMVFSANPLPDGKSNLSLNHRTGWWENLQENPLFDGKNHGFLWIFSLIEWFGRSFVIPCFWWLFCFRKKHMGSVHKCRYKPHFSVDQPSSLQPGDSHTMLPYRSVEVCIRSGARDLSCWILVFTQKKPGIYTRQVESKPQQSFGYHW